MISKRLAQFLFLCLTLTHTPWLSFADEGGETRYSTASDRAYELIKNGIALHDQGKYSEAVQAYEQALIENPGNLYAIYEITYAYLVAGDYEKALSSAQRGKGHRSPKVAELYMLSATALDKMGRPEESVAEFLRAIELYPNAHGLRLNLTITYLRMGDVSKAQVAAEQTIMVKPEHPSAHLILGQIYAEQNKKVPALMAIGRFLTLEPNTARTQQAIGSIRSILRPDYTVGKDGKPVVVMGAQDMVDPNTPASGFQSVASQLKIVAVGAKIVQDSENDMSVTKSPEYFAMASLSGLLAERSNYPDEFASQFYLPFYRTIDAKDYNHAFARLALASLDPSGASSWMRSNKDLFGAFRKWSKHYIGPDNYSM